MSYLPTTLYAFFGVISFGVIFNIRGKKLWYAGLGGAMSWLCLCLLGFVFTDDLPCFFFTSIAMTAYAEVLARVHKTPVIVYLVAVLIPLVPGSDMYYTMEYCISGEIDLFLARGLHTMGIAGAIALGILMVSSVTRLLMVMERLRKKAKFTRHNAP